MKKDVSMRAIAEKLGVSTVTVSKALSGKKGVSDALRAKIEQTAQALGYVYAKANDDHDICMDVGILIPSRFFGHGNSFYASLCKNLVEQLSNHNGYGLLEILEEEDELQGRMPVLLSNGRVKGLVVLGQIGSRFLQKLIDHESSVPLVCMDFSDDRIEADAVVSDNVYASMCLTNHLINMGHTRIGFLGSIEATSSIMDRYLGYYKSMLINHLPFDNHWLIPDRDEHGEWIACPLPHPLPTAFVCNCDQNAMLFIKRLQALGLHVPEDVSVVSFDNFCGTTVADPALTTYAIDKSSLARETVRLIFDKMKGRKHTARRIVTGGHIIYRDSVQDINGY